MVALSKFIAAMDNSGGSVGGVLDAYGVEWTEENKMDLVHEFRMRMINAPAFNSDNIRAAIVYSANVDRGIVDALKQKDIEVFLKIDYGCKEDGTLKQIPIKQMIEKAVAHDCYGTKMRSIVKSRLMIEEVLDQQFKIAETIYNAGLMPIVEPEVPIDHPNKELVELRLLEVLADRLDWFDGRCILKLTPPEQPNLYYDLTKNPAVEQVVFLSGGYSTNEACNRLGLNENVIASFSRATSEGLTYNLTDDEFNAKLEENITKIKEASE